MKRVLKTAIVLLVFNMILISCSTNNEKQEQYAGEINGQLIERSIFTTNFLYNYNDLIKGNKNYKPTTKEINRIEDETWKEIIKSVIISQFVSKHNIEISQGEVIDSLLNNPPSSLVESSYFKTKGSFDEEKYRSSIINNEPVNTEFIKYNYNQLLTFRRIQEVLIKNADISKSDVEKYYEKNYSTSDIILLKMYLNNFQPTVTNTEVELRWAEDKNKYYYQPSLDIKYLIQEIEPTEREIAQTRASIDSLYFKLSQGGDFDSAVLEFSSNLSLYPMGKMPFIKIENVPEIIRSYVASAQVGDVISPVSKKNVWYIYKVLEKTKSMVKLQELKHPVQISQNTILQRREEFMQVEEMIRQIGIEEAAFEFNWQVYTSQGLNLNNTFVDNLGDLSDLIKDAYGKADGYIYPPIYNKTERFLVMVQIEQNRLNKKKELDLVFNQIKEEILKEKQFNLATNRLRNLADDYENIDKDQLNDVVYELILDVNKDSSLMSDHNDKLISDIFSLSSKGHYTKSFHDDEMAYIAVLLEHNDADKEYFKRNYFIIQGQYRHDALSNYYTTWLDQEIDSAKVKKWFNMQDLYKGNN
jgi:hypothetical protein